VNLVKFSIVRFQDCNPNERRRKKLKDNVAKLTALTEKFYCKKREVETTTSTTKITSRIGLFKLLLI
jgi:hypothetical protein